jgi:hypothetical protein
MKSIWTFVFLLELMTTTIVVSQDNSDNQTTLIVNENEAKSNVTCLCTEDEKCDGNSRTCSLKHPDQTCYQSWTWEPHDNSIRLSAGYVISNIPMLDCRHLRKQNQFYFCSRILFRCVYNDFFFVRLWCAMNQTDRYIVCCSQRDYCNDLDAYSKDIRNALLLAQSKTGNTKLSTTNNSQHII